jgi:hypothetical protein
MHEMPQHMRGNLEAPLFSEANRKLLQLVKVAKRRHGFEDLMHGCFKLLWVRPFIRVDVAISQRVHAFPTFQAALSGSQFAAFESVLLCA